MSKLSEESLRDLLAAHADLLNEDQEEAERFVREQSSLGPETLAYLLLALRLKRMLVPVVVPQQFRRQLREQLLAGGESRGSLIVRMRRHPVWMGAAAAGSLLPLLGLLFFWRRRQRAHGVPSAS